MSGQLRTLKNRIRSVESTKKITRAMEMVAAAKLRRFQDMMVKARPYTDSLQNLLRRVSVSVPGEPHPFLVTREEKKVALVLITSDTGLCGSYNHDLVAQAKRFLNERGEKLACLIGVGKSGITALKRMGRQFQETFTDTRASRIEEILAGLQAVLEKIYLDGSVDAIYVIYNHFLTLSTYKSAVEKLLPLEKPKAVSEETKNEPEKYIFEPSAQFIFEKLIPLFFQSKVRTVFLESFVSEQIARMRAMHQATENAKEMIDTLVLLRNKARQAAITKELIEIVSGSLAAKLK